MSASVRPRQGIRANVSLAGDWAWQPIHFTSVALVDRKGEGVSIFLILNYRSVMVQIHESFSLGGQAKYTPNVVAATGERASQ